MSQFSDVEQETTSPEMPPATDNQSEMTDVPYGQMRMLRLGTPKPKQVRKGKRHAVVILMTYSIVHFHYGMQDSSENHNVGHGG